MIITAIALFLVAALFGIYMALRIFGGAAPPWTAVVLHGLFAASGLVILLYATLSGAQTVVLIAAASLLVIAALGGFVMFSYQLRKAPPPKALVVIHALAAVAGVLVLAGNVMGMV